MPWYRIPFNVFMYLFIPIYSLLFATSFKARNAARHKAGYLGMTPMFAKMTEPTLCMSTPSTDLPAIPHERVICCGPILQDSKPLQEVDLEMYTWIKKGPTVLIALGTLYAMDQDYATLVMTSVRVLLDRRPDVQVLWKLSKWGDVKLQGVAELGDRLRVVDWLEADPLAYLEADDFAAVVNHGGSNSYHEALWCVLIRLE
jgi:hypothetical protein